MGLNEGFTALWLSLKRHSLQEGEAAGAYGSGLTKGKGMPSADHRARLAPTYHQSAHLTRSYVAQSGDALPDTALKNE